MKMARISTPGKKWVARRRPTRTAYSHHAGPTMAGIWVALHDISTPMGRVKVLPGSHKGGVRKGIFRRGSGRRTASEIYPRTPPGTWRIRMPAMC